MTLIAVRCPHCHSEQIIKRGKTARGTQRYLCQNALCTTGSFLLDYHNRGCVSEVKQQIRASRVTEVGGIGQRFRPKEHPVLILG